jgi:hypothetical protein
MIWEAGRGCRGNRPLGIAAAVRRLSSLLIAGLICAPALNGSAQEAASQPSRTDEMMGQALKALRQGLSERAKEHGSSEPAATGSILGPMPRQWIAPVPLPQISNLVTLAAPQSGREVDRLFDPSPLGRPQPLQKPAPDTKAIAGLPPPPTAVFPPLTGPLPPPEAPAAAAQPPAAAPARSDAAPPKPEEQARLPERQREPPPAQPPSIAPPAPSASPPPASVSSPSSSGVAGTAPPETGVRPDRPSSPVAPTPPPRATAAVEPPTPQPVLPQAPARAQTKDEPVAPVKPVPAELLRSRKPMGKPATAKPAIARPAIVHPAPAEPKTPHVRSARREEPPITSKPDEDEPAARPRSAAKPVIRRSPRTEPQTTGAILRSAPPRTASRDTPGRPARRNVEVARPVRAAGQEPSDIPMISLPDALRPTGPPAGSPL